MCEVDKEIDTLRTARCLEIKKVIGSLFKHRNYDNHKVRISTLNEEISKKEKVVNRLKEDLDDKDTNVFEKTTNFKAEES
jgi:flagellar biosynthesis chaperone FliJ